MGLFGDSLAVESEPYFNLLVQASGRAHVTDFAYGGTAACDWLSRMRRYARTEHPRRWCSNSSAIPSHLA